MSSNKPLRNFARQGNYYARSIGTTVEIFNVSDGDYASKYAGHCCYTHTHDFAPAIEGVCNCSVSPDGKIVAAVSKKLVDSKLHLRSIETGEIILEATAGLSTNRFLCCAFNPHLKMIAAGVRGKYDIVNGKQLSEVVVFLCPPGEATWKLAFRDARTHRGEAVVSLNFSPSDGRRLLSVDGLQCAVFDVQLKADAVLVPFRVIAIPGVRFDHPLAGGIFLRDSSTFVTFHSAQLELVDADRGNIKQRCWAADEEVQRGIEIRAAAFCHIERMSYDILVTAVTCGIDVYRVPRDLSSVIKVGFVSLDSTSACLQFAPCLPLRVAAANSAGGVSIVTLPLACGEIAAALGMQREAEEMKRPGAKHVPAVVAVANSKLTVGDTTSISWTPDGTGFVIARPAANALSIFDCVVAKKKVAKHEFDSLVEQIRFLSGLGDEVDEHGNKKPPQLQVAMRSGQTVKVDAVQPQLAGADSKSGGTTTATATSGSAAASAARERARAEIGAEKRRKAEENLRALKQKEEEEELERRLVAEFEAQERRAREQEARFAAVQKAKEEAERKKQQQKQQLEAQKLEQERQAAARVEAERKAKIEKERQEWEAFLKKQEQQKEEKLQQQMLAKQAKQAQQDSLLLRGGAAAVAPAAAAAVFGREVSEASNDVDGDVDDWLAANERQSSKAATEDGGYPRQTTDERCEAAWAAVQQQEEEQQEAVEQPEEAEEAWCYEEGWEEGEEGGDDDAGDCVDNEGGARRTRRRFLMSARQASDGGVHEAEAAVAEETVDED